MNRLFFCVCVCPVQEIRDHLLGRGGFWHSNLPPFSLWIASCAGSEWVQFAIKSIHHAYSVGTDYHHNHHRWERSLSLFSTCNLPSRLPPAARAVFCADRQHVQYASSFSCTCLGSYKCLLSVSFLLSTKVIDETQGSPRCINSCANYYYYGLLEKCWVAPLTYENHREWHWKAKLLGDQKQWPVTLNVKTFPMYHISKVFRIYNFIF